LKAFTQQKGRMKPAASLLDVLGHKTHVASEMIPVKIPHRLEDGLFGIFLTPGRAGLGQRGQGDGPQSENRYPSRFFHAASLLAAFAGTRRSAGPIWRIP